MAFQISQDLYENDIMSASEIDMGYRRPVQPGLLPAKIPADLLFAHETSFVSEDLISPPVPNSI